MTPKISIGQHLVPNLAAFNGLSAGNQTWSSWSQIAAAGGAVTTGMERDFVCCGAYYSLGAITTASGNTFKAAYMEIGYGKAGDETPLGRLEHRAWINKSAGVEQVLLGLGGTFIFEPFVIPAKQRVAVRAWANASGYQMGIVLFGYYRDEWDLLEPYNRREHQQAHARGSLIRRSMLYPDPAAAADLGTLVAAPAGTTWTYGDWVEIVAKGAISYAALARGVCAGVSSTPLSNNTQFQIQIGLGEGIPRPLDVVGSKTTVGASGQSPGGPLLLARGLYVPPRERVCLRVASAVASQDFDAALILEEYDG